MSQQCPCENGYGLLDQLDSKYWPIILCELKTSNDGASLQGSTPQQHSVTSHKRGKSPIAVKAFYGGDWAPLVEGEPLWKNVLDFTTIPWTLQYEVFAKVTFHSTPKLIKISSIFHEGTYYSQNNGWEYASKPCWHIAHTHCLVSVMKYIQITAY